MSVLSIGLSSLDKFRHKNITSHSVYALFEYSKLMMLWSLHLNFQLTGYKPFVEACIDAGQKTEALKYIPKLTDPRERSEV